MGPTNISQRDALEGRLSGRHFAFVEAQEMNGLLGGEAGLADWDEFSRSWEDLPEDEFMADGGRYRRRRHAVLSVPNQGPMRREPAQAHFQSRDRNPLNGGIERWFGPVEREIAEGPTMTSVLSFCRKTLLRLRPEVCAWHTELHQFRISAGDGEEGMPTPEGLHRDGVDFVLVLLVKRSNVLSGTTSIADLDRVRLGEFTLSNPMDTALVDDRFVFHGVTPIRPENEDMAAFRDVLVVTWKADALVEPGDGALRNSGMSSGSPGGQPFGDGFCPA